ncbi:MAG TPA: hypothetical protein EYN86_02650, partial [Planctomycetes bacterium]|nr:hypothetical protein [Planctomycetota bacterium]
MRSDENNLTTEAEKMSSIKRWSLIGIAVFCLLIFTVTGPMTDVLTKAFSAGPPVEATVEMPSGTVDITLNDYRIAASQKKWSEQTLGRRLYNDDSTESVLAYATLIKLANEMKIQIADAQLQELLVGFASQGRDAYRNFYRSQGFASALQFESQVRQSLRVSAVVELLSTAAVPAEQDILDVWAESYQEMSVQ